MATAIRLTLLFTLFLIGTSLVLFKMFSGKFSLFGSDSKLKADTKKLRRYLSGFKSDLVPLTQEEIPQLSLNYKENIQFSRLKGVHSGSMETVFHEPLVHFSAKLYPSEGNTGLLLLRTSDDEIGYVFEEKKTFVLLNGKKYGYIDSENQLWSQLSKQKIGHILQTGNQYAELFVNNKKLANIVNPSSVDLNNMRAFSLVQPHELYEQRDFVILSMFYLLSSTIRSKK